ncbi:hypothetical protein [Parasitella parasitica]|uniref:BZIP domain-containing protein n=1 Tax=Parasitella parasitica TaxID=35722 RepID=A0A0B7NHU3_9FUNG|nr:hypothetical protein [Parasitella parasitica]
MTNNTYWQPFPTNIVDTPSLLMPQQPPASTHLPHSQQQQPSQQQQQQHSNQQQSQWSNESDKRKWNPDFSEFDLNPHANKMFHMDDYNTNNNNNDPSEGDSPDSAGSHRRHDLLSDSSMFQGGDQKQRRKEQNRAAQRAFRERKERYVKELQIKIKEMEKKHHDELARVNQENDSLKSLVKKMEVEIYTLKGAAMAFNMSISKLREAGLDVQTTSIIRDTPSPPQSVDRHPSPPARPNEKQNPCSSAIATLRDKDGYSTTDRHSSISDSLFDSVSQYNTTYAVYNPQRHPSDDDLTIEDDEQPHSASFAEPEVSRFEHKVDPMINSGAKMIPCSQIWERLSQHPNFDEFDMDELCKELKKKAICSGTGPVIPESELQEVLLRMDSRQI